MKSGKTLHLHIYLSIVTFMSSLMSVKVVVEKYMYRCKSRISLVVHNWRNYIKHKSSPLLVKLGTNDDMKFIAEN